MKYAIRVSVLLIGLLITIACARANGPGGHGSSGGHGGSGGHGSGGHGGHGSAGHAGHGFSGHGGHSAGTASSGNPAGHSFMHSFPRIFHPGRHKPKHSASAQHIGFFPRHRHFGSTGCASFGFFSRFAGEFDCFNNGFFFDPFFFGAYSMLGSTSQLSSTYAAADSGLSNEVPNSGGNEAQSENNPGQGEQPVTLLQLLDGSMYGLTSYQVVGNELHYTTTYGGQNSVPLERIDFAETLKLNAERNVPFVLEPKPRPPAPQSQLRP